jgi:hypothetical protein
MLPFAMAVAAQKIAVGDFPAQLVFRQAAGYFVMPKAVPLGSRNVIVFHLVVCPEYWSTFPF